MVQFYCSKLDAKCNDFHGNAECKYVATGMAADRSGCFSPIEAHCKYAVKKDEFMEKTILPAVIRILGAEKSK